ncbi:acetate--CoA ligase family protein [Ruegeria hyattellae]|uniref:acetate--CoA ligase family protein n=1 Tax=Ruegeria hyattellae TaxID=3233337 RepID=UPI00355BE7CF
MSFTDRMFDPRSVAVIGASPRPGTVGQQVVENLMNSDFTGSLYPVNPSASEVLGLRAYGDIACLPEVPDLAVLAIPASACADALEQAGRAGIPNVIVLSSGFSEVGQAGKDLQIALTRIARRHGIGLIGPNCQGLMNMAHGVRIGFGTPYSLSYKVGKVGVISQSGAFGNSILLELDRAGIGVSKYISTGNEAGLKSTEVLEQYLSDPSISTVAMYIEGLHDLDRFGELARSFRTQGKQILLWKVGNSAAGARAATRHTANLCIETQFEPARFAADGVIAISDIDHLVDAARALGTERKLLSNYVAIASVSGGVGIEMADQCAAHGLNVSRLSNDTEAALTETLPEFASLQNPVDLTGTAFTSPEAIQDALLAIARDRGIGGLLVGLAAVSGQAASLAARTIANISAKTDLPIMVASNAPRSLAADAYSIFESTKIPVFRNPARCVRALKTLQTAG